MSRWQDDSVCAGKKLPAPSNGTMLASALAYSSFFAIPSVLIVATGLFTLIAGPQTITNLISSCTASSPPGDSRCSSQSLHRADAHPGTSIVLTIFGFVLAVWSVTGAMNSYMLAVNIAYGRKDKPLVSEEAHRRAEDGRGDRRSRSRSSPC